MESFDASFTGGFDGLDEGHRLLKGVFGTNILTVDLLARFLVQSTIIIGLCSVLGMFGKWLNQPRVVFEIVAGILLGPSWLSHKADGKFHVKIFPASSMNYLYIVANVGLVFYLFLVGIEMDPKLLLTHAKRAGGISFCGICLPFCLGMAIAHVMFQQLQANDEDYGEGLFFEFVV